MTGKVNLEYFAYSAASHNVLLMVVTVIFEWYRNKN